MSTYVNDLRLEEIGTGERSGTWGTATNTSLELIGEALGFGTEAITTNADTHTTTVADGATDPGRAIFLKYTGTLDSACTITIAPNTISRLHFIENGTSGSQNIIISQGSGADITIPPGDVKVVYLDGAGSGAAVVDAFASLSVVDLKVQDDLTVTDDATIGGTLGVTGILTCTDDIIIGDGKTIGSASDVDAMTIASNGQITLTQTLIGTALDISGDIDIDGTSNLDVVDIDGAVDMASTLQVDGVATFTGRDVHSGGITIANAGQIGSVGDTDAIAIASDGVVTLTQKLVGTELDISGDIDVDGTTNLDVVDIDGAVDMASTLAVTGIVTLTDDLIIGDGKTIGSASDVDAMTIASNGQVTFTQTLIGTALDISGDVDVDGTLETDNLTIGGAQGTDGQVLTSTGSGVGWEDAGGGGVTFKVFGTNSIMVGDDATGTINSANQNTALGLDVFAALTTGDDNVAIGFEAGQALTSGVQNVFVGSQAGKSTDDGFGNVAVGINALDANCANYNTAVGYNALGAVSTSGNQNTGVGSLAGFNITFGDNNTCIGNDAGITGSPGGAITTGSNRIALGDENVTHIYAATQFISTSDARDKTDFTPLDLGLDFVKALAPLTFKWDKRSKYGNKYEEGYDLNAQTPDGTHKEDRLDVGFKAQDVEALEIAAGYNKDNNTNLISDHTDDGTQIGIKYGKLIPVLVKAIQEQNVLIEALTSRVTTLEGS